MAFRSRTLAQWAVGELALRGDERVLLVACGDGAAAGQLLGRLPEGFLDAMEASPGLLHHARRRHRQDLQQGRLTLHQALLPDAPTGEAVFEVVFGVHAAELLADPASGLAAACALLKPGGRLVLASTYRHNLPDSWRAYADRTGIRTYRPRELDGLLRQAGLIEVRETSQPSGRGIIVAGRRPGSPAR